MRKIITGAAFICLFSSNAFALGDGINIAGLKVNPSVTVSGQYDDNITRSESRINELTSRFIVDTTASYAKSHDARGTTFSGIATGFNTPDRWHEAAATAKLTYGGTNATGRIEVHGGFSAKRYDNHRRLTIGRDLNTENGGATFYYRIAPKTSALFESDYDNFDYRLVNSLLDSYNLTFYGGLTWEATAKTAGTVKAGWQRKKSKRGNQSGGGFFSLDADITWTPLTYSTWTLKSGIRATESDSNGISGSYIKTNDVLLDWNHKWSDRLSHTARVGYVHDRYIGTARRDNTITAGLGLNYALAPWLGVGAGYDYANRASNVLNAAYHESVYSISVTAAGLVLIDEIRLLSSIVSHYVD